MLKDSENYVIDFEMKIVLIIFFDVFFWLNILEIGY